MKLFGHENRRLIFASLLTLVFLSFLIIRIDAATLTLDSSGNLDYVADGAEVNNLVVSVDSGEYVFDDAVNIDIVNDASGNCTGDGTDTVTCDGDDISDIDIDLDDQNDRATIESTKDSVSILGGDGDDNFYIGNNSESLDDIDSAIDIDGEAGDDTILVLDSGDNGANDYEVSSSEITRSSTPDLQYEDIEELQLELGDGENEITISSTSADIQLDTADGRDSVFVKETDFSINLDAGDDDDIVEIGDDSESMDGIDGALILEGKSGDDSLVLLDSGDDAEIDYVINSTKIERAGIPDITYSGLEEVEMNTGDGADDVKVESLDNDVEKFVINTNKEDDKITLGNSDGTLDEIVTDLTINGGDDEDTLLIDDSEDEDANEYVISGSKIERESSIFTVSKFEIIQLDAGIGDDEVMATASLTASLDLDGGDEDDADVLNVDTNDLNASDDGNTIEVSGREPIQYADFEDVNMSDFEGNVEEEVITGELPFKDVVEDHTFYDYILSCYKLGICKGFSDDTYRPDTTIKRKELFTLVVRAFEIDVNTSGSDTCDDIEDADIHEDNIAMLLSLDIISGDSEGNCRPNDPITRGETTKVIYKVLEYLEEEVDDTLDYQFEDEVGNKFTEYIAWLADTEVDGEYIVSGYENDDGDKVFGWDDEITRGQFTKILDNSLKV